ncbi:hypothetical protein BJ138DRAFT_1099351 [Hygrophoropsis aurantiaca]|uniref:Uncharacterized protein n=1 Tax=Hygrophoropsis aurantiaca TaxID=72124 RepID=A0ACB8AK46_9AGAM|nr:hypothetical protein BJ138DRAFT_1099351 [Hygrophoropsis aurantiaca]
MTQQNDNLTGRAFTGKAYWRVQRHVCRAEDRLADEVEAVASSALIVIDARKVNEGEMSDRHTPSFLSLNKPILPREMVRAASVHPRLGVHHWHQPEFLRVLYPQRDWERVRMIISYVCGSNFGDMIKIEWGQRSLSLSTWGDSLRGILRPVKRLKLVRIAIGEHTLNQSDLPVTKTRRACKSALVQAPLAGEILSTLYLEWLSGRRSLAQVDAASIEHSRLHLSVRTMLEF